MKLLPVWGAHSNKINELLSYCGLNNVKHREILDDLVDKGLVVKKQESWDDTTVLMYKASEKGMKILIELLQPDGKLDY